jgi:hypothetical protein
MKLPQSFNAATVAPSAPIEVIPVGWYPMTITASENKETSKKNGSMLALEFTIIDGQYKGRKFFSNLNLVNPNAQAVEIAYAELSAICHATGVMIVEDSSQLHNIPLDVKVGMRKPDAAYPDPANEIKGYKRLEGVGAANATGAPPPLPAAIPPAATAAPAAAGVMPWATAETVAAPAAAAPAPVAEVAPPVVPPVVEAPAPAPVPTPAPAPVIPAEPVKTMTEKAAGATYEAFIANGWTDAKMIEAGYMVLVVPEVAAPAPAANGVNPPWAN